MKETIAEREVNQNREQLRRLWGPSFADVVVDEAKEIVGGPHVPLDLVLALGTGHLVAKIEALTARVEELEKRT